MDTQKQCMFGFLMKKSIIGYHKEYGFSIEKLVQNQSWMLFLVISYKEIIKRKQINKYHDEE